MDPQGAEGKGREAEYLKPCSHVTERRYAPGPAGLSKYLAEERADMQFRSFE